MSVYTKVLLFSNLVMREINVHMHITFKIIGEIQHNIIMKLQDASFGIFQIKSSLLMELVASLEMTARNVMDGCNKDIIRLSIQANEILK